VLELARRKRARVLQASTSEVYGDPEVHPQQEDYFGHVNPIGPRACYDEGKRGAETLFFDYHRLYGIPIKVARIFNTYGPRMVENDGRVVSNFIVQALRGQPLTIYGTGTQTRSFCYADDLVEGLVRLMDSGDVITGPCNLGNPKEITVGEAARLVIALTGSKSPLRFMPLPEDDPKRRRPAIEKAVRLLGWRPRVSFESGLKSTIAYFSLKILAPETPQIAPIEYAAVSGRKKSAAASADDVVGLARSFT
jgi:UDP-glucuronate decarboxylase